MNSRGVKTFFGLVLAAWFLSMNSLAAGEARFPQPDFTSGYTLPETTTPMPRGIYLEYLDVGVLAVALALATWLALKGRSRRSVFLLTVFAVLYFGFWRKGCVCAVGALQNLTQAIIPTAPALPVVVAIFFLLPLAVALYAGRTFCSGVCPLGAIQDLFVMRPIRVPEPVSAGLSLFAYIYLGLAVLLAATGAGFIICRYDPFIGLFRLTGRASMIALGGVFLIIGMVIARPYCRWLCPYGVLLKWMSRFSARHLAITPDACIQCRLCEDACPFGAIRKPQEPLTGSALNDNRRRVGAFLLLLPLLAVVGGGLGYGIRDSVAGIHPAVSLAREIRQVGLPGSALEPSLRLEAFRQSTRTMDDLEVEVASLYGKFTAGSTLFGIFMGLVIGGTLLSLSVVRPRSGYEPDRGECLSCGRCLRSCPVEHVRLRGDAGELEAFLARIRKKRWGGAATDIGHVELKKMLAERDTGREDNGEGS